MTHFQILVSIGVILFVFGFLFSALTVMLFMFAGEDKKRVLAILKAKLRKRRVGRIHR